MNTESINQFLSINRLQTCALVIKLQIATKFELLLQPCEPVFFQVLLLV